MTEANILEQLREQVNQLAAGEINIATARMRLKTFLAGQGIPADDVGMTGKPPAGVDEKTWKARKSVTNLASTRRLDLILRQNSAMAHAVGRREVSMQPAVRQRWPYFRYLARMDGRQRATHGRYNNLVLPKQHPFWHTHTGPWDFECRCDVEDADEAEAKEYGKGQVAGTKIHNPATGQTFEDLPNESGFEFDIEAALAGDPENFDWGQIKNAVLREKVRKAVAAGPAKKKSQAAGGEQALGLARRAELDDAITTAGIKHKGLAQETPTALLEKLDVLPTVTTGKLAGHKPGFYIPEANFLNVAKTKSAWAGTRACFHHEFGHHAHHRLKIATRLGVDPAFREAYKADLDAYIDRVGAENMPTAKGQWRAKDLHLETLGITESWDNQDNERKHRVVQFFDSIAGMSNGRYGFGHAKSYWGGSKGASETFANCYSAAVNGWQEFEKDFPSTMSYVKGVIGL